VLGGAILVLWTPVAKATPDHGTIARITVSGSKFRAWKTAWVEVHGRTVQVGLWPGRPCVPGDRIELWRNQYLWGVRYAEAPLGCRRLAL